MLNRQKCTYQHNNVLYRHTTGISFVHRQVYILKVVLLCPAGLYAKFIVINRVSSMC